MNDEKTNELAITDNPGDGISDDANGGTSNSDLGTALSDCSDTGCGGTDADGNSETVAPESGSGVAAAPIWRGKTVRDDISRRQNARKRIAKEASEISFPVFTDTDSISEFQKKLKEKNKEYHDACSLIDYDLDMLKAALRLACEREIVRERGFYSYDKEYQEMQEKMQDELFAKVYDSVPMSVKDREKIEAAEKAKLEAEEKARKAEHEEAKKRGEIDGQMKLDLKGKKIKGDDGSTAEAASECTTRPLVEGEELADPKPGTAAEQTAAESEQIAASDSSTSTAEETTAEAAQTAEESGTTTETKVTDLMDALANSMEKSKITKLDERTAIVEHPASTAGDEIANAKKRKEQKLAQLNAATEPDGKEKPSSSGAALDVSATTKSTRRRDWSK